MEEALEILSTHWTLKQVDCEHKNRADMEDYGEDESHHWLVSCMTQPKKVDYGCGGCGWENFTDPKIDFMTCSFCGLRAAAPERLVNLCSNGLYSPIYEFGNSRDDYCYIGSGEFRWVNEENQLPYFASIPLLSALKLWLKLLERACKNMPVELRALIINYTDIDSGAGAWSLPELSEDFTLTLQPILKSRNRN
jgi:hypothetical protein